jgi:hypothetical protein
MSPRRPDLAPGVADRQSYGVPPGSIATRGRVERSARNFGRWPLVLALAVAHAVWIPASSGLPTARRSIPRELNPRRVLLVKDRAIESLAAGGRYLAWELSRSRAHPRSALMERDESTGAVRRLAADTLPQFGLASTATRVVYAAQSQSKVELVAVRHDGSGRTVLTRALAAPIAVRGHRVAWAEQQGLEQRVVVADMGSGRRWIAARMPSCRRGRCYRIDAVTLADGGVVFDRGAIGAHPSLIVRRRFRDSAPSSARVPNDPQPDLAPSSAGAFYYWLAHGWVRWDFGKRRPHLTDVRGLRRWVLDYERGRVLLLSGSACRSRLNVQRPRARIAVLTAPASTPASPKQFGPLCSVLRDFTWDGRRLRVAWSVIPKLSQRAHSDVGLVGVVTETETP